MINSILNFSVRQRMLVILATVVLIGIGLLAVKQIPIDAFPDVTNVQVQVLATAGGMSPPEVEKLVTRPIEIQGWAASLDSKKSALSPRSASAPSRSYSRTG
jgi:cobalt-zinc-cadmium resistance protein CzcA